VALLGTGIAVSNAVAREAIAPPTDPVAMGVEAATQLVGLMDRDKNGRVSKAEFMNFLAAEFDRLDKDKSGELDVQELRQSP
jgi:Ca2+-binding EF-hand superfamily protein